MVRNDRVQRIGGINGLMRGRIRLFSVARFVKRSHPFIPLIRCTTFREEG